MNFFAHFLVDRKPNQPQFNAALIAPDLLRHFLPDNNRINWQSLKNDEEIISANLTSFCDGGLQHILRDKLFLQSSFFEKIYQNHRESWSKLGTAHGLERWWFSLHVSVELIIDKILISNHVNSLYEFYNILADNRLCYKTLLTLLNHKQEELFLLRFDKFLESQYLFHYREFSGIAYALHRIHYSLNIPTPWHPNNTHPIITALNDIESDIIANCREIDLLESLKTNN
jgi:hypothetical protein